MAQLIAGNWKMNGTTAQAEALLRALAAAADPRDGSEAAELVLCPPATKIGAAVRLLGNSERRQNQGELDETVREKVLAARRHNLVPIVCVGETLAQRDDGQETEMVGWQIKGSLPDGFADHPGVLAYEPVWAIGTGKTASADDIRTMHAFIREELRRQFRDAGDQVRILYGGSVKPGNASELLGIPEVGGALVGGASLVADDFLAIWRAAH